MPANTTVTVPANTWTQITSGDATAITFQNLGTGGLAVLATVGATPPTSRSGAILYPPLAGERNTPLSDLFPGVSGATRVYARSASRSEVMVSHV